MPTVSEYATHLAQTMQTPEYISAPLEKQQEVYNLYLGRMAIGAQEFQHIPMEGRAQWLMDMTEQFVPSFENPEMQEQVTSLYQRAQAGEEEAINQIDNALAVESFKRRSLIMGLAGRLREALGHPTSSLLDAAGGVPGFLDSTTDPDTTKALNFLRQQRQMDPEWRKHQTVETVTSIGFGMAENIGSLLLTTGLGHRSAIGLGKMAVSFADEAIAGAVTAASSLRTATFIRNTAAATSHAFATGVVGATREVALDAINIAAGSRTTQEAIISGLKNFGSYVAIDLIANLAFDVMMPMLKANKKIFTNWPHSNESAAKVIADLAAGNMVSPQMIKNLDEGTQEAIMQYVRGARILQNVQQATPTDLLHLSAARHGGFVNALDDGGFEVKFKDAKDAWTSKRFATFSETESFVMDNLVRWTPDAGEAAAAGAAKASPVNVSAVVREELPDVAAADRRVLSNIIAPRGGKFEPENIRQFARQTLKAANATDDELAQLAVRKIGKNIEVSLPGGRRVRIPENLGTRSELPHIRRLVKAIQDAPLSRPRRAGGAMFHEKTYQSVLERQDIFTPEWGLQQARAQGYAINQTPEGLRILSPDGESFTLRDAKELTNFFVAQKMTPDWVSKYLRDAHGLNLVSGQEGYALKRGKKLISENYQDIDRLVRENPDLFNKLPETLAPRYVIADNGAVAVEVTDNVYRGSYREGMEFLSKFKQFDDATVTVTDVSGNALKLNRASTGANRYRVEFEALGYTSPEMPLADAKKLLNEAGETFEATNRIAMDKGYRLETSGGKYVLYDGEGHRFVAEDMKQVSEILGQGIPVPSYAPELIHNPDELIGEMKKIPEHLLENFHYGRVLDEMDYTGLLGTARQTFKAGRNAMEYLLGPWFRVPQAHVERLVKQGADPFFARHLRHLRAAADAMVGNETRVAQTIDDIVGPWKGSLGAKGKQNLARRREVWAAWLEAPDDTVRTALQQKHGMGADEIRRVGQIRDLWGKTPQEGLYHLFGVPPDMFLNNYLPHIRKAVMENPGLKNIPDGEWKSFYQEIFGENVPKEFDQFFAHRRSVQDALGMALERDPIALLHKYSMVGHRKLFLGNVWSKYDEGVKAIPQGGANQAAAYKMTEMRADMMGIMTGPMADGVNRAMKEFLGEVGLNPGDARKVINSMMGAPYLATMAARPWLAMRNAIQPYITLAPRYGNRAVAKAQAYVVNNATEEYVQQLMQDGIIKRRLPLGLGMSLREHPLTEKVFRWYKNADEVNRATSYEVAVQQWDEGVKLLKKDAITWDQFVSKDSGIQFLYKNEQEHVLKLLTEGHMDAARLETARSIVSQSQFDYMAGNTGIMSRTLMGKAFGQFATYPIHYLQNMVKGFADTKGLVGKSLYAATSLGNGLALYTAFEKVLGINANNFLPWVPTVHSGGPWWSILSQGIDSLSGGYSGRQARAEFLGLSQNEDGQIEWNYLKSTFARNMTPGYYAFRSFGRAMDNFANGDIYQGILNLGSFPLDKDYFARGGGFNPNFQGFFSDMDPFK